MESRDFALIEMLLFGAIAIGVGLWQLWSVNRDIRRREQAEREQAKRGQGGDGPV